MSRPVVFAVVSAQQWLAAREVASHLEAEPILFNPYVCSWEPLRPEVSFDLPRVTSPGYGSAIRAARYLRARLAGSEPGVIVFGQDVGLVERACIAQVRRRGWRVVLMPDGLAVPRVGTAGRWQGPKSVADAALGQLGLLAGRRGRMGSTRPDLLLSWGERWGEAWAVMAPGSRVVATGSPRSIELAAVTAPPGLGRILICSQPFASLEQGFGPQESHWWSWLHELAACDAGGHLRLRLHPGEVAAGVEARLGGDLRERLSGATLVEDLSWTDYVLSPFSTVAVEAAGCGRGVAIVDVGLGPMLDGSPFFRDPRLVRFSLEARPHLVDLQRAMAESGCAQRDLGRDYLADPSQAASLAARALADVLHDS